MSTLKSQLEQAKKELKQSHEHVEQLSQKVQQYEGQLKQQTAELMQVKADAFDNTTENRKQSEQLKTMYKVNEQFIMMLAEQLGVKPENGAIQLETVRDKVLALINQQAPLVEG